MNPELSKWMNDISKSVNLIDSYLIGVSGLSDYKNNFLLVDAVERRLAIIGEALWCADKKDKSLNISNKNKIVSLRHILVHDYDLIEDDAIWIICKKHLPILKQEVETILKNQNA